MKTLVALAVICIGLLVHFEERRSTLGDVLVAGSILIFFAYAFYLVLYTAS